MVSLQYLDRSVTAKGWIKPIGRSSVKSRPDGNAMVSLEHFDALRPEIPFCGVCFWVIVSSSPSHMCAHNPLFLSQEPSTEEKFVESEACSSLWKTPITERAEKRKEMS